MEMFAYILMIGPYKKIFKDHMDFESIFYDEVTEGTKVLVHLFKTSNEPDIARLAEVFGISDYLDPSQYEINKNRIDFDELEGLPYELEDHEAFQIMIDNGMKPYLEIIF